MHHQPAAIDRQLQPGAIFVGATPAFKKGQLTFSIWIRPSCTASTELGEQAGEA
jgi:hypothetical protein